MIALMRAAAEPAALVDGFYSAQKKRTAIRSALSLKRSLNLKIYAG
jgi:hypothetical protein